VLRTGPLSAEDHSVPRAPKTTADKPTSTASPRKPREGTRTKKSSAAEPGAAVRKTAPARARATGRRASTSSSDREANGEDPSFDASASASRSARGRDEAGGSDGDDDAPIDGDAEQPDPSDDVEVGHELPAVKKAESSGGSLARFDPMAAYLREIQRHPLLTPEQTHDLAVKFIKSQDAGAAAQLVTSNLRLVVKIAYEYRRAYKNIMDLVQEGNIGLMQAVKRYDPYRGVKLSSYAAWWIRAYILRFVLNNWRLVKLGTTQAQRKLFFNLRKKRAELVAMGIDPTDAEVAKRLNVPESDVAEMDVRLTSSEKSLDAPVGDAEGRSIAKVDMMPSMWEGPEALVADEELQALLKEKLAGFRQTLAGKEKDLAIFDERLVADDPLTLQELGDRFKISRERVRQLEQRLTSRLREYLSEEMGDATRVS
jgi:RNA polymerase sigma-32 factor